MSSWTCRLRIRLYGKMGAEEFFVCLFVVGAGWGGAGGVSGQQHTFDCLLVCLSVEARF